MSAGDAVLVRVVVRLVGGGHWARLARVCICALDCSSRLLLCSRLLLFVALVLLDGSLNGSLDGSLEELDLPTGCGCEGAGDLAAVRERRTGESAAGNGVHNTLSLRNVAFQITFLANLFSKNDRMQTLLECKHGDVALITDARPPRAIRSTRFVVYSQDQSDQS